MTTVKNPLKLNDWPIKSFLVIVFSVQLVYLGTVGMSKLGIELPFLRQIIGFVYITFIPGYLLLRILRVHNLSSEESLLYAVGLSLFFDMFVGFLVNMFYPMLGITDKPISEIPIVVTFALVTLSLAILAYFRDENYYTLNFISLRDILSPQFLFLSLIPFMSIFGTYSVNYYHSNIILVIMILAVAVIVSLTIFTDIITEDMYPYVLWIMAISLIFHTTLITNYIQVQDVIGEYYTANTVITWSFWRYTTADPYNSVLSATILPAIIHNITVIPLTWIYKVIFPFLLSLMPPFVYQIYMRYLPPKESLASAYFIVIPHPYFITIPFLSKQLIAEIFMILFIHLVLTGVKSNRFLRIVFILGIILSHYGTAYLVLGMLIFMVLYDLVILALRRSLYWEYHWGKLLATYTILLLGWYIYVARSISFIRIIYVSYSIITQVLAGLLFNPLHSRGAELLTQNLPFLGMVDKYMYTVITLLMILGVISELISVVFTQNREKTFDGTYLGFSMYWVIILGATVAIPGFAVMNPYRLYHLSSITLSPFAIVGIKKLVERVTNTTRSNLHLKIGAIYLVVFLLLNSGVANEILKMPPFYSSSINQETSVRFGNIEDVRMVYGRLITTYDVTSSKWIKTNMDPSKDIYSHSWGYGSSSLNSYGGIPLSKIKIINNSIPPREYIFMPYMLVKFKLWYRLNTLGRPIYYKADYLYIQLITNYNVIYTNSYCRVLIS